MSRPIRDERTFGYAVEGGLYLMALGVPVAMGGVHTPVILATCLLACLTFGALWVHRRNTGRGVRLPWFGMLLLGVTGYTALQLVPLPINLLQTLAPQTVAVLKLALEPLGGLRGPHPISLDTGATQLEVLKLGSCALAFIIAHNHLRSSSRRKRLLAVVTVGAALLVFLGLLGAIAVPGKPLMLYNPVHTSRAGGLITTSFVNPNHAAGYLTLCALLAIGLAVGVRDMQRKVLAVLLAVLLGTGVFLSLSRGGILALAAGMGLLTLLLLTLFRSARLSGQRVALVPGIMAVVMAGAAWLAHEAIRSEFEHTFPTRGLDLGKIAQWPDGLEMVLHNPWVGVGRGAFATSFPRYFQGNALAGTWTHMENQYLHLPAELGIPVAGALILLSAVALVNWMRRGSRDIHNAAVGAALLALALHNLVDFNLEILGLALPAAVLAGFLSAGATSLFRSSRRSRRRSRGPVMTVPLLVVAGLLAAYTGVTAITLPATSREDARRLRSMAIKERPAEQILEQARAAIWRHPADYFPHLLGGQQLLLQRKPESLAWLNRSLLLYPGNAMIHLQTAEAMLRFGRQKQALLEFRLAMQHGARIRSVLHRALLACQDTRDIQTLVPDESESWITAIYVLVQQERLDLALKTARLARWWWSQNEDLMVAEIAALYQASPIRALLASQQMVAKYPGNYLGHLWLAASLERVGPPGASIQVLLDARLRFPTETKFDFRLVAAYLGALRLTEALSLSRRLMKRVQTVKEVARVHRLLSRIYHADRRYHRARFEAEAAKKILGSK